MIALIAVVVVYTFGIPLLRAKILGPVKINFGTKHVESPGNVSLNKISDTFSVHDPMIAWFARFEGPLRLTNVDLLLSKPTESGGELVVAKDSLNIADPRFTILFGYVNPFTLLLGGPGKYRLRIVSDHTVLAQGEFDITGPIGKKKR